MASPASGAAVSFFSCFWIVVLASGDQQITVKSGDDVTLQCQDTRDGDIELLEWRKRDPDQNVFVWRNTKFSEDDQHQTFKDGVKLKDPEMKNGNVSVILKNININDTGTYECHVRKKNTDRPQLIIKITLTVTDSGDAAGNIQDGGDKDGGDKDGGDKGGNNKPIYVALIAVGVLVIVLLVILILKKRRCPVIIYSNTPPADVAADHQPT